MFQALHNPLSKYYEDVLGVKGASGESAPRPVKLYSSVGAKTPQTSSQPPAGHRQCGGQHQRGGPRDGDSAEVAVSAPRPLKLRRSDPPLPPAQAAAGAIAAAGAGAAAPSKAAGKGARWLTCGK